MERSKEQTTPHRMVSLFAGIGGFELGFRQADIETTMVCEIDPIAQHVLKANMPGVQIVSDVRELTVLPEGTDILCAGFPCQDISTIGVKARDDGRTLSFPPRLYERRFCWSDSSGC